MAANTIGRGNIIITASMDDAIRDLDKLEKKSANTKKKIDSAGGGGGMGFLKAGGAGFAAIGAWEAIGEHLKKGGSYLADWVTGARKTREQLEAGAKAAEAAMRATERRIALRDEGLGAIANRADLGRATSGAVTETARELDGVRSKIVAATAELDKLRDNTEWANWAKFAGRAWSDTVAAVEEKIKGLQAAEAKLSDELLRRGEAAAKLRDPTKDPALIGAANSLTESLREQAATWGLTGRAAQIAALQYRGATGAMIADAAELASKLDKLDELQNKAFQPTPMVGAMEAGSAAAYSLTTRFQVQGKEAERHQKRQADALDQIKADIRKLVNKSGGHTFGSI
jgi:hypothetical protein